MAIGRVPGDTGIQPTIVDAKGDIIAATAADSVTRLAVGSNNQVLTADSTTATGLKWAAPDPLTTKGDLFTFSTIEDRLPVGANDTVLTADSSTATGLKWAAPSSGSLTLLSTTSLSGTSTTISNISQSYTNLWVLITAVTFNANANLRIKLNGTGSNNGALTGVSGGTALSRANIEPDSSTYTGDAQSIYNLVINNYTQTTLEQNGILFYGAHRGSTGFSLGGIGFNGSPAAAVTSIQITTAAGTSTFSTGSVRIYGVK